MLMGAVAGPVEPRLDLLRCLKRDRLELGAGRVLPRYSVRTTADAVRIVDDLRPPSDEAFRLHPEAVLRPLAVKYEHGVAGSADSFTLGTMLFFEPVYGNDVPGAILIECANPHEIKGIPLEPVGEVNDFFDARVECRQLPDAMGQMP